MGVSMKFNLTALLLSALALTCTATPLLVQAQTSEQAPARAKRGFAELNLTETQQAAIKQIRQDTRAKMQQILTPEQVSLLAQTKSQSGNRRAAKAALNLTEAQKAEMKALKRATREQIKAVLTPAQQEQLRQKMQQRQSRRQGA